MELVFVPNYSRKMYLSFKKFYISRGLNVLKRNWYFSNILENKMFKVCRRENSYCKHKYCSEVEAAVNNQIQAEQQAAQSYLNMAAVFLHPCTSRPGTGGFFMRMYHEELQHMEAFIHYQLCRGGIPLINGVKAPLANPKITIIEAFKLALDLEHTVTELLENLICIAENAKDYHCIHFVTAIFIEEQMDAINKLAHHMTEITRICENEDALWNYDLHLATKYPYKYKPMKK